ncbi:hypothetical protein RJ639_003765 [Escallonia herrerae]|uniref:Zinc finger, CCHC-type n=1 Tax=Escallonia herrerae TaxID=1293975 RepID=A0AA88W5E3_9ASTE|nr:hypothetical protein RJ639_003765 [Escallonia herrerae]
MHFLLVTVKVYYVIVNPRPPEPGENEEESVAKTRERLRWDQDDEICRGHILNGMSNTLFDAYHTVKTAKELWNQLERRYITEDATSKRFIVSKFFDYKMVDGRSVMEQFNEIKSILDRYSQHKLALDEFIVVTSIIDKLPPSWKNFRNSLKHRKEDINLDELGTHLRIEEDLRKEEKSKSEGRAIDDPKSIHSKNLIIMINHLPNLTPAMVLGFFEVVEGDGRVVVRVAGPELQVAGGERTHDFFEEESALEDRWVEGTHGFHGFGYGFRRSLYLGREHPKVHRRALTGKVLAAGGLDVASERGDTDDFDERDLDGDWRGDEDGIHWVIGHALANQGLVQHHRDIMGLEVACWAQPTQHQKLWASQCSSSDDHFILGSWLQICSVLYT